MFLEQSTISHVLQNCFLSKDWAHCALFTPTPTSFSPCSFKFFVFIYSHSEQLRHSPRTSLFPFKVVGPIRGRSDYKQRLGACKYLIPEQRQSVYPEKKKSYVSGNETINEWIPCTLPLSVIVRFRAQLSQFHLYLIFKLSSNDFSIYSKTRRVFPTLVIGYPAWHSFVLNEYHRLSA